MHFTPGPGDQVAVEGGQPRRPAADQARAAGRAIRPAWSLVKPVWTAAEAEVSCPRLARVTTCARISRYDGGKGWGYFGCERVTNQRMLSLLAAAT